MSNHINFYLYWIVLKPLYTVTQVLVSADLQLQMAFTFVTMVTWERRILPTHINVIDSDNTDINGTFKNFKGQILSNAPNLSHYVHTS
jgi:hypothetical protein